MSEEHSSLEHALTRLEKIVHSLEREDLELDDALKLFEEGLTHLRNAQQVLATLVGIGQSRLELITVELEEERLRLARLWIAAAVTLFFGFVAQVLLAGWIVLACDPADRLAALGALSAGFAAAAGRRPVSCPLR